MEITNKASCLKFLKSIEIDNKESIIRAVELDIMSWSFIKQVVL